MLRVIAKTALECALLGTMAVAVAQDFPKKPIRMVTAEVGGGSDFIARMLAQGLASSLGQPVIVDNRAGGGSISGEIVAKASPDGYTLLVGAGTLWIGPLLRKTAFDTLRDFAPVSLVVSTPNILAVHPSVPSNSVKELIGLAKSKPGALNFATGPTGSANHLAAELFKLMTGIEITRIPYRGSGPGLNALLGGEVQMMFPSAESM